MLKKACRKTAPNLVSGQLNFLFDGRELLGYTKRMRYTDCKRRNEIIVNMFNSRVKPEWRTQIQDTTLLSPFKILFYYDNSLSLLDALREHVKRMLNLHGGYHVNVDYLYLTIRVYSSVGEEIGVFDPKNFTPEDIKQNVERLTHLT